jgi:hypothetical protein
METTLMILSNPNHLIKALPINIDVLNVSQISAHEHLGGTLKHSPNYCTLIFVVDWVLKQWWQGKREREREKETFFLALSVSCPNVCVCVCVCRLGREEK